MPVFQHLHTDSCIAPTGFLGREKDWKSQQKHVRKIAEFVKEKKTLKKDDALFYYQDLTKSFEILIQLVTQTLSVESSA